MSKGAGLRRALTQERHPIVWTPTIHPFTEDGRMDEDAFRRHARRLVAAGVHLYLPNEGQGENWALTRDEIRRLMTIAKDEASGKVRVLGMGRQAHSAREQIEFIEQCQAAGLDGVLIYGLELGHSILPTEREQEAYLSEVLGSASIPMQIEVIAYSGYHYPIALLERMVSRFAHVRALMLATPDQRYIRQVVDALLERVEIHTPPLPNLLELLVLGVSGFGWTAANLIPRMCASVLELYAAGRYKEMVHAFVRVQRIGEQVNTFNGTRDTGRSEAVKAALNILGLPGGYPRKPRLPVPPDRLPALEALLKELRVAELEGLEVARA